MRPKNLPYPFSWEKREPLMQNGVLFVPAHYDAHNQWQQEEWNSFLSSFSQKTIEYCSGNGAWIVERAKRSPERLWIAVEKRFDRVRRIWSKTQNEHLPNVCIVCGEANVFTRYYLQEDSVEEVYVNFPDPWPKERHAKNRLIQGSFIHELSRVVKKQGRAMIVTDDASYSSQVIQEMTKDKAWGSLYADPFYITDYDNYGSSYFEVLWKEQGRQILYMQFENLKQEPLLYADSRTFI